MKFTVGKSEKISYLYDYVESEETDCGFEDEVQRNFDILRPYDQLNLSEFMNKTLEEVFEGSEMESLIVKEKD